MAPSGACLPRGTRSPQGLVPRSRGAPHRGGVSSATRGYLLALGLSWPSVGWTDGGTGPSVALAPLKPPRARARAPTPWVALGPRAPERARARAEAAWGLPAALLDDFGLCCAPSWAMPPAWGRVPRGPGARAPRPSGMALPGVRPRPLPAPRPTRGFRGSPAPSIHAVSGGGAAGHGAAGGHRGAGPGALGDDQSTGGLFSDASDYRGLEKHLGQRGL